MSDERLIRLTAFSGVVLFGIGMLTGLWAGVALAGKVWVAIPHLALAAHLNGLLGAFWLFGLAFTLPMLSYGEAGKTWLVRVTWVPTFGNWLITLVASFAGVRGLTFTGDIANDVVAALLLVVVVLPTLVACGWWAWGFRRRQ